MKTHKILLTSVSLCIVGTMTLASVSGAAALEESDDTVLDDTVTVVDTATDDEAGYTFTIDDATAVQKYAAQITQLSDEQLELYDVMPDDVINIDDATRIQKVVAEITDLYDPILSKTELNLEPGESETLNVMLYGKREPVGTWTSSDSEVAEVDENGKILAKNEGTATITYTLTSGGTENCNVTVGTPKPTLNKTETELKVGEYETLSAAVSVIPDMVGTWESSDSYVAEVDENGEIFAKCSGTATVTYTLSNGNSASCTVTVDGTTAKCFDISAWQPSNIDFAAVKARGYDYVILRAGYGRETYQEDSHFASYYTAAKEAGLKVGVYWFSYATSADEGAIEAQTCLTVLNGRELDLPVYFDVEYSGTLYSGAAQEIVESFCATIEENGYSTGVYASASVLLDILDMESLVDDGYSIWNAHWDIDEPTFDCDIWQYADGSKEYCGEVVDGVEIDLDYIYNLNILTK